MDHGFYYEGDQMMLPISLWDTALISAFSTFSIMHNSNSLRQNTFKVYIPNTNKLLYIYYTD